MWNDLGLAVAMTTYSDYRHTFTSACMGSTIWTLVPAVSLASDWQATNTRKV